MVMHDRTRRLLCRTGFLAFCLAPTLLLATWIGVVRSPSYQARRRAQWQRTLGDWLGLTVAIRRVSHPTRGVTLLDGVALADPETAAPVARIRHVEIGRGDDRLVLLVSQPELQADQMWRLWEVLDQRILRSPLAGHLTVQLAAGEVTVHRPAGQPGSTLADVRCQLAPAHHGPQATIEFRDVAWRVAQPAVLRITRNRRVRPPATEWQLQTRATALPCSILADQIEALGWLGEEATFQGTVRAMPTTGGWEGEIRGRFRNVDLDRLVTDRYNHKLSGTAEIIFHHARFRNGKLIDAAGEVAASGGVVSWSLLDQARKSLGLVADARVRADETRALWRYRELRFGFTLNDQGLRITGRCQTGKQGVVLADARGPLLSEQPNEVAQVVALVRALAPEGGEQVPATLEAYQLLDVLPIPSQRPPRPAASRRIYSPLRLR